MSGVFRNIDPRSPHRPASVYPPLLVRGEDTLARGRWGDCVRGGVNSSEDARHCSVLYICKYFVAAAICVQALCKPATGDTDSPQLSCSGHVFFVYFVAC
jgi:hypothetical protein